VTVTNTTIFVSANVTNYTTTTVSSRWYRDTSRVVQLEVLNDNSLSIYPTCFRPDIGGDYVATLTVSLPQTPCFVSQATTISVVCGTPPDLSMIGDLNVGVDREIATRAWLNASSVVGTFEYNWRVVYPTSTSLNPVNGQPLHVPTIMNPRSVVSSFWIPQSGVTYVIELSVSDGCQTIVKNINIQTPCNSLIPLTNKTLAAYYDGEVPVTLMSFAYDHTQEVANFIAYPKCQTYMWTLVDYSQTQYSASLGAAGTTDFVKTGGFAALISIVVIIAVIVPVIIWMYCTKKACFDKTDARV